MTDRGGKDPGKPGSAQPDRAERLSKALRENLKRRKAARRRENKPPPGSE